MLSIAVYARVSTDEQAEHGYSLSAQIEQGRVRADRMGADEVVVYSDPAASSITLDRPGLAAMRIAIAQRRHQGVIIWDQDRLSRDAVSALVLRDEILSAGCQLIFLQGGATTAAPDDFLLYGIKALMAQSERLKIRARTMMGRRQKAEMGVMPGKFGLYGYAHDTRTGQITVASEQAEWVQKIFKWCAEERVSTWVIARRLAAAGAASPRGQAWRKETVARMLRNDAYKGTAYVNKYDSRRGRRLRDREAWIPVAIPPIVAKEVWENAQATLNENRERTQRISSHEALLRGLLTCGRCGKAMRTLISPGTRHIPRYYCNPTARCQPGDDTGNVAARQCPGTSVRMAVIDPVVMDWATNVLQNPALLMAYGRSEIAETAALEQEVTWLNGAIARCRDTRRGILGFFSARLISEDEANQQLARVSQDARAFQHRLREVQTMLGPAPLPGAAERRMEGIRERLKGALSITEQSQVLRELIDHIAVWANPDVRRPPDLKIHLRVGSQVADALVGTRSQNGN